LKDIEELKQKEKPKGIMSVWRMASCCDWKYPAGSNECLENEWHAVVIGI